MCWVCKRLETLVAGWNEESEFQGQTSTDHHRGMSKGFHECARDLSEVIAALRLKGICEKFPEYEGTLSDKQRWDLLDDILKLRDEDKSQE
jgi:hypothetical protein